MAGEGRCGFLHLSFQEYLAAEHAAREGLAKELAARATESWWREVALLSLRRSRPHCEAFFREMLRGRDRGEPSRSCPALPGRDPLLHQRSVRRVAPDARPQGSRKAWFWTIAERFDCAAETSRAERARCARGRDPAVVAGPGRASAGTGGYLPPAGRFARPGNAGLCAGNPGPPGDRSPSRTGRAGCLRRRADRDQLRGDSGGRIPDGIDKGTANEQPVHRVRITHGFCSENIP